MATLEHLLSRILVDVESGCWNWSAGKTSVGYGAIWLLGKQQSTHRVVYEHFRGPIPDGRDIDHLCRNRACCNPYHLEPVSRKENVLRGEAVTAINFKKTHCNHGHEFTPENTIIKKPGWRDCRICNLERVKRNYQKKAYDPVFRAKRNLIAREKYHNSNS